MNPSPLTMTAVYLALGAKEALHSEYAEGVNIELQMGEYEYLSEVLRFAVYVDDVWRATADNYFGCFPYEVIEPLGKTLGGRVLRGETLTVETVDALLHDLIRADSEQVPR